MSETETEKIPGFLEGEPLPSGYFNKPDPYGDAPTRKVNLSLLVSYARKEGKDCLSLTKEEIKRFSY